MKRKNPIKQNSFSPQCKNGMSAETEDRASGIHRQLRRSHISPRRTQVPTAVWQQKFPIRTFGSPHCKVVLMKQRPSDQYKNEICMPKFHLCDRCGGRRKTQSSNHPGLTSITCSFLDGWSNQFAVRWNLQEHGHKLFTIAKRFRSQRKLVIAKMDWTRASGHRSYSSTKQ